jgi:hypothetical protein
MASARSIGNVYAELSVKDKMTAGLTKAQKKLDSVAKGMIKVGSIAGGAMAAGIAVAMKSAVAAGGELADMMARTGADGEQLYILGQAFKNAGLEAAGVGDAVNKMQRNMIENGEAFEKLGMNVADLKKMDPAAAFRAISENIAKIADPAERTAAAMEIFGKSGAKMLAVINDPSAFSQAEGQVGDLGKTLSENAATFDAFGDAMGALGLKGTEFGAVIAGAVLPPLSTLVDLLSSVNTSGLSSEFNSTSKYLMGKAAELWKMTPSWNSKSGGQQMVDNPDFDNAMRWAKGFPDIMSPAPAGIPSFLQRVPGADITHDGSRISAPAASKADQKIIDEIRRTNAILSEAKGNGGLNW